MPELDDLLRALLMITRDGDRITMEISMQEYQALLVGLGYAIGSVIATGNRDLREMLKQLLAAVTEVKHGAE